MGRFSCQAFRGAKDVSPPRPLHLHAAGLSNQLHHPPIAMGALRFVVMNPRPPADHPVLPAPPSGANHPMTCLVPR